MNQERMIKMMNFLFEKPGVNGFSKRKFHQKAKDYNSRAYPDKGQAGEAAPPRRLNKCKFFWQIEIKNVLPTLRKMKCWKQNIFSARFVFFYS